MTEQTLKNSKEFKEWIADNTVAIIHHQHRSPSYQSFIVIHRPKDEEWSITRFMVDNFNDVNGENIIVSVDAQYLSAEEVFKILLTKYK